MKKQFVIAFICTFVMSACGGSDNNNNNGKGTIDVNSAFNSNAQATFTGANCDSGYEDSFKLLFVDAEAISPYFNADGSPTDLLKTDQQGFINAIKKFDGDCKGYVASYANVDCTATLTYQGKTEIDQPQDLQLACEEIDMALNNGSPGATPAPVPFSVKSTIARASVFNFKLNQ